MQHALSSTPSSLVWISGATEGIGLGLARNVPYANARVINLSRRQHPDYESHFLDLAEPASWDAVGAHFAEQLSGFTGERAIFIQNAHLKGLTGFVTEVSGAEYQRDITANVAAPLRLGEMYLRAVRESGFAGEAGLVMMSSSAARSPVVGQTVYCAGKAALEMWVRVTRRELALRAPHNIWVTAVRPGFVDTALTRHVAAIRPSRHQRLASARSPPPAVVRCAQGSPSYVASPPCKGDFLIGVDHLGGPVRDR